ncbi:MAG: hypothetical protein WBR18_09800 [Anaerolineales bacterium]
MNRLCYTDFAMQELGDFPNQDYDSDDGQEPSLTRRQRLIMIGVVAGLVLLLAAAIGVAVLLVSNPQQTETLRDVFIIFMSLEFLVIGLAMIVLILQLARLTALLQNEVQPILKSTNETVKTLRGTTTFLSKNLLEPVVRANSSVAALRKAIDIFRPGRSR